MITIFILTIIVNMPKEYNGLTYNKPIGAYFTLENCNKDKDEITKRLKYKENDLQKLECSPLELYDKVE